MHNVQVVQVAQRLHKLLHKKLGHAFRQAAPFAQVLQHIATSAQFHVEQLITFLVIMDGLVKFDDVRVAQLFQDLFLSSNTLNRRVVFTSLEWVVSAYFVYIDRLDSAKLIRQLLPAQIHFPVSTLAQNPTIGEVVLQCGRCTIRLLESLLD